MVADWSCQVLRERERENSFLLMVHLYKILQWDDLFRAHCCDWNEWTMSTIGAQIMCAEGSCCISMVFIYMGGPDRPFSCLILAVCSSASPAEALSRRPAKNFASRIENCFSFATPTTPDTLQALFRGEAMCESDRPTSGVRWPEFLPEGNNSFTAPQNVFFFFYFLKHLWRFLKVEQQ